MNDKRICEVTGKTCFSKKEAGNVISHFKNNKFTWNNRKKTIPKRSYYCQYCGTYHLTHYKKK